MPAGKWGTTRLADSIREYPRLDEEPRMRRELGLVLDRPVSILSQFSARLREIVSEAGVHPEIASAILPGGFVIPASADAGALLPMAWSVITDMEVFGEITEVTPAPVRKYRKETFRKPDELTPGDYVVHIDYGIGRFAQLTERTQSGVTKSYVEVEYAGRDRLFVPVEQLDRLRRYSYDGTEPKLNNLGRELWRKTKEKVQRETLELARRLLSLYKTRQIRAGFAFSPTTVWEEEFADAFPYVLTEDQLNAWREVGAGHGGGQADGPPALRRRRLRQDRDRHARRVQGLRRREAGADPVPDHRARRPALHHFQPPLPPLPVPRGAALALPKQAGAT